MSQTEHVYTPPRIKHNPKESPEQVLNFLNGEDLLSKTQALRLSTVNADGWPHAALLSAGDMISVPNNKLRFVIFPHSETTINLRRDKRLTLSMSFDGKMCELRTHVHEYREGTKEVPLAFFEATVDEVRLHQASYADIVSGVCFKLHDPSEVNQRWQLQIAELRKNP